MKKIRPSLAAAGAVMARMVVAMLPVRAATPAPVPVKINVYR
jgi:hypothetical protein